MQLLGTLCYLKANGQTLMMLRNRKPRDMHRGKWNGLGGKIEPGESPTECIIREVREESGLEIQDPVLKAVLTFPRFVPGQDWIVFLFRADRFDGELGDCPEGELDWIPDHRLPDLELWEGDRLFMPLLEQEGFFTGKFVYRDGTLVDHHIRRHHPSVDTVSSASLR